MNRWGLHEFVQTYIARAYLDFKRRKPDADEIYWIRSAEADTALIVYFGPLTGWYMPAIFGGVFRGSTALALLWPFGLLSAVAYLLARRTAAKMRWKEIAGVESATQDWRGRLSLMRAGSWLLWSLVNPLFWYLVLPKLEPYVLPLS